MAYLSRIIPQDGTPFSPLMLSDRLLTLAQDADRAGYRKAAEHLLSLAEDVLDQPLPLHH